ncbi:hypothetical protein [Streptomyces wuyuanensis]
MNEFVPWSSAVASLRATVVMQQSHPWSAVWRRTRRRRLADASPAYRFG